MCKSRHVEIVQDAAREWNTEGKGHGGVSGKTGYKYSSSGEFLVQGSTCNLCSLTNTTWHSFQRAAPPGTSRTTSLETKFSTQVVDSLECQVLLWYLIPL